MKEFTTNLEIEYQVDINSYLDIEFYLRSIHPKFSTYKKWVKGKEIEKKFFTPFRDIFADGPGEQIKQNALDVYDGVRGGVLERSLHRMWKKDVFGNKSDKGLEVYPSILAIW